MLTITPTYSGEIDHGRRVDVCVAQSSEVRGARHQCLALALAKDRNAPQLWIDDDITGVTDEVVAEMLAVAESSGADVVTGWYFGRGGLPVGVPMIGGYHGRWTELVSCGFGCVLIMPRAWRYIGDPTTPIIYPIDNEPFSCPSVFDSLHTWDHRSPGEDVCFCIRARREKLKIVAANRVGLTHRGLTFDPAKTSMLADFCKPPKIEAFVNHAGPDRPCRARGYASLVASDLSVVTVLGAPQGTITRGFVQLMESASRSTSRLVLLIEDDVEVVPDIASRITNWIVDCGPVWASERFAAASLCRLSPEDGAVPHMGTQCVLSTPQRIREMLDAITPGITAHLDIPNTELRAYLNSGGDNIFDVQFWGEVQRRNLASLFAPKSWARHLGADESTWWGPRDGMQDTLDFVGDEL